MNRRQTVKYLAATAMLGLCGCLAVESIETPDALQSASVSSDSSLVYGRLRWIENGTEPALQGNAMFGQRVVPRLKRVEDKTTLTVELDNAGHFVWALEEGTYIIDKLQLSAPEFGTAFLVPKVAFRVPENGNSFYIGTLRADVAVKSGFWGIDGEAEFSVQDEMRAENTYVRKKLGRSFSSPRKSLMVQDDTLPDSFDTTAEFGILTALLGAPW